MNNFVKISITGRNPKLFVKRYFFNRINYSNYKEISYKQIVLKISYEDYLKLIEKNTIYEIQLLKYYGPIKYITILKENYTFFIAFIIGIIYLFLISNTCFDVDVVHNNPKIRNLVFSELKDNGIEKLKFIPNFQLRKKIINEIIKNNKNELEWMEIERKGSKIIVKVTERKINKKSESNEPRHIVAKKSGIIISVEAENGVILKKKNDYVNEGEVIISGDIIKDETVKGQVRAKGKVLAETWYMVNVTYPLNYEEIIYLDDVKNNVIVTFMNKEYQLRKNYASVYLEKKYQIVKSKLFPFDIRIEKQRKTKVVRQKYSKEEAVKKAEEIALEKIKKKLNTGEYIISKKTLNFTSNNSKIEIDVFFKVCEDITDYKEADKSLLEKSDEQNT